MLKGESVICRYARPLIPAIIIVLFFVVVFFLLFIYRSEVGEWQDSWKSSWGVLLYSAWTSTGVYLARFALTTLFLASFIEPFVKRFVEPHKRVLADVRAWLTQDFAAFDKENVSRDFSNYFDDCKKDIEYQEKHLDAKVDQVIQSSYPLCFLGALLAFGMTLLGIDNFAGPCSLLFMWPLAIIWWQCRKACVAAEKEAERVRDGFRQFTDKYRKRLNQDNQSYTQRLNVR